MGEDPGRFPWAGRRFCRSHPTSRAALCGLFIIKCMRYVIAFFVALSMLALGVLAQEKKAPDKIVFEAKMGKVTYDHAKHVAREKNNCKVCHDALFPQSKAPLNFKAAMHKTAETNKTSCGFCHRPGGQAFETKGNCTKCHVKG